MESQNMETPIHEISNYISTSTGLVTAQYPYDLPRELDQSVAFDRELNSVINDMDTPAVHCYFNKRTGKRTSMYTTVHGYAGGFAVTRGQSSMSDSELQGRQLFDHTSMTTLPHGVRHVFSLASRNTRDTFIASPDANYLSNLDNTEHRIHAEDPEPQQMFVQSTRELPSVAREHRRKSRELRERVKGRELKLSEEQLFASAVKLHARRTGFLSHVADSNPYLRSHHLVTKNRTLAYTSVFLSSERGSKAILSVFWETKKKPHCAATVNLSITSGDDSMLANCSCDYLITQTKDCYPNCWHAQVILHDDGFIDQVKREIRRQQEGSNQESGSNIFGNPLDISSIPGTSPYLTIFLERQTNKKRVLANPWMFFVVLDARLQLFIPLVKVFGKGLQCMGCRLSPVMGGDCSHVETCLSACQALYDARSAIARGFLMEIGINFNRDETASDSDRTSLIDDDFHASDSEDDLDSGINQSVQLPEIYYPTTFTRRILPCPAEQRDMKEIAKKIDQVPIGEQLALDDRETVSCHKCGSLNMKPRYEGHRREVVLFTLAQGSPKVNVYDWYCDICNEKRLFTGKRTGVFPARKKVCYTTELMYLLLEMTCTNALSLRTAYRITRLFERTQVARLRFGRKVDPIYTGDEGTRSRRRTNEAFRAFVRHLDTSSSSITAKLFSCDICEVPLAPQDCEELEIEPEAAFGMKRMQAIVIDGTAAGILTKLPDYDRHTAVVPPAQGGLGSVCIILKAKHRKILTKFLDMVRIHLRKWKLFLNCGVSSDTGDRHNSIDFPNLVFWIHNPSKASFQGVMCEDSQMTVAESHTTQLYINGDACFCPLHVRQGRLRHTERCLEICATFSKAKVASEIHEVFKQLFIISQYAIPDRAEPSQAEHQTDAWVSTAERGNTDFDDENDNSSNEEHSRTGSISGAYVRLLLSDLKENTQFIECNISTLQFLLLEHVAMPYVGRLFVRSTQNQNNNEGQNYARQATNQTNEGPGPHNDGNSQHNHLDTHMQNETDVQDLQATQGDIHMQDGQDGRDGQDGQDDQDGLHVQHVQHILNEQDDGYDQDHGDVTQEWQRLDTQHENAESNFGIRNQETTEGNSESDPHTDNMISFTSCAIEFHKQFISSMHEYMVCLHFQEEGRIQNVPQECRCVNSLKEATVAINEINPVLGAFGREFLKLKRPLSIPESCFGSALLDLLRHHIQEAENFFITLKIGLPEECEQYWRSYGMKKLPSLGTNMHEQNEASIPPTGTVEQEQENHNNSNHYQNLSSSQRHENLTMNNATPLVESRISHEQHSVVEFATDELQEALETGLCFPGRRSIRPSIMFKSKDKPNCSKQYKTSKSHSPGFLTVQCACDAPKLIGFVVMTQAESTALALSSVLTHFPLPPRAVFYDNACNLFTSVMIRVPWLLGRTRLAVDRFHYKSHKCFAYFNPDSYRQFDMQRTETAESINARIEKSLSSVRYLNGDNLMSFLRARFALINLAASFKQVYNRTDVEDEDLTLFFNEFVTCSCDVCNVMESRTGNEEGTKSVSTGADVVQ